MVHYLARNATLKGTILDYNITKISGLRYWVNYAIDSIYWRDKHPKVETFEGTPSGTTAEKDSRATPSSIPVPGLSSCDRNSLFNYEQTSLSFTKSTTALMANRHEILKTLRNAASVPNAKEEKSESELLTR